MIKTKVPYVDFLGNKREDELCFNLNEAEISGLMYSVDGGLQGYYERITAAQDTKSLEKEFSRLLQVTYGEVSADGRRFVKSEEMTKAFTETPSYSKLYMKMANDADWASKFWNGVIPTAPGAEVKVVELPYVAES